MGDTAIIKSDVGLTNIINADGALVELFISRHVEAGTFGRSELEPASSRKRRKLTAEADDLKAADKWVLYMMARLARAEADGALILRGSPDLAFRTAGVSTSAGYRAIDELAQRGIVRIVPSPARNRPSIYVFPFPPEIIKPPSLPPPELGLFGESNTSSVSRPVDTDDTSDSHGRDTARAGRDTDDTYDSHGRDTARAGRDTARAGRDTARAGRDTARAGRDTEPQSHNKEHVPAGAANHDVYDEHHHDDVAAEASEENERLLREINIGGFRLDPPGIRKLLCSRNCTPANIAAAVKVTASELLRKQKAGKSFSPMGFLFKLVNEGCTPPPTPEERRKAQRPEHVQEQDAAQGMLEAVQAAREQAIDAALATLGDDDIAALMRDLIAEAPNEVVRRARTNIAADKPREAACLRERVYEWFCRPSAPSNPRSSVLVQSCSTAGHSTEKQA